MDHKLPTHHSLLPATDLAFHNTLAIKETKIGKKKKKIRNELERVASEKPRKQNVSRNHQLVSAAEKTNRMNMERR